MLTFRLALGGCEVGISNLRSIINALNPRYQVICYERSRRPLS